MKTTLALLTILFLGACQAPQTINFNGRVMVNKVSKTDTLCTRQNVRLHYTEYLGTVSNFSFVSETDTLQANFVWHKGGFEGKYKEKDYLLFLSSKREATKKGIIVCMQSPDNYIMVGATCLTKADY